MSEQDAGAAELDRCIRRFVSEVRENGAMRPIIKGEIKTECVIPKVHHTRVTIIGSVI